MLVSNAKRKSERKPVQSVTATDPDAHVGDALRSVYEKAIEEAIPQEMLDLLGQLK